MDIIALAGMAMGVTDIIALVWALHVEMHTVISRIFYTLCIIWFQTRGNVGVYMCKIWLVWIIRFCSVALRSCIFCELHTRCE